MSSIPLLVGAFGGCLIFGTPLLYGSSIQDEAFATIDHFIDNVDKMVIAEQAQIVFLTRAEKSAASEDQRQAIDIQIGALEIELHMLTTQRDEVVRQAEAAKAELRGKLLAIDPAKKANE